MKRTYLTLLAVAGLTAAASAQTITPGLGGVAITGQSGAGIYLPWNGGASVGAPGVGSYSLNGGGYTAPWAWSNYSNPTAYNFNTGSFNYSNGYYGNGYYNGGVYNAGYYNTPWAGGNTYIQSGYNGGYYYPSSNSYYYPSSGYTTYSYPTFNGNGRGNGRGRWR